MTTTQLADVIIPEVYATYQAENSPESTALFASGIIARSSILDQKANSGGSILDIPFWKDLDATQEPNISSDDPDEIATPKKIQSAKQVARIAYLNDGWSTADLADELAGSEPMRRIAERTSNYWNKQLQRRLIASAVGVMASNVANDDSDMVIDISAESIEANSTFSRQAFTASLFTAGDQFEIFTAIATHSMVLKRMIDNDDIDFIKDSTGTTTIPTFLGRRVIVDDSMPVNTSGAAPKYTSILFGSGVFGYGIGSPKTPVEIQRKPDAGKGAGIETLWERKTWLVHPFGTKFLSTAVARDSATLAELKTATNWERVVERKNMPLAFLVTKG